MISSDHTLAMADPPKHFFKFIPPAFNHNLSIPMSFLPNLINGGRCSKAILRRGGHEWPVEITDGGFSGDGWRKCFRENGVQKFDFMVFKHQGNMVFDFLVFEPSTCERQFPNLSDVVKEPLTESDSIIHTNRSRKLKKHKRNDYASQNEENIRLGDDLCFIKKMTPYSIKTSRLHVPVNFVRSNGLITERIHRQVNIRDETRRTWPATLHKNKEIKFHISVWREFKVKNHLKEGDSCMFELVKGGDVPILNFYNIGKKPIKNCTRLKKENNSTIKNAARSTSNNYLYFTSTLKPWNFKKSILRLPIDFVRSNGLNIGKMILRDDKSRPWEVLLKEMKDRRFYLGCGFRAFLVANKLKEGDTFKFELVENENNKPPVVKFSCKSRMPINFHKKENFVPKEEDDDHPRPYFVSKLKSGNIKQSTLYLPTNFAKKNGLFNNREMILKNGKDERSWIVELKNHKNKYSYIGRGWKDFLVANDLKKGDHFKLQIIENIGEKLVVSFYVLNDRSSPS